MHFKLQSRACTWFCVQAVNASCPRISSSRSAAGNIHRRVASTTTGRLHAQLHRTKPHAFASGSEAAAAAPAPQTATESSATPPESDEAPQFPLSAAVVAAAAAAMAAGRDLLAATAAIDRLAVNLAMLASAGAVGRELLSGAVPAPDPGLLICCGAAAAAIWCLHLSGALERDRPRSAAWNLAGEAYWGWHLAWQLTGAFLPVRLVNSSMLGCFARMHKIGQMCMQLNQ